MPILLQQGKGWFLPVLELIIPKPSYTKSALFYHKLSLLFIYLNQIFSRQTIASLTILLRLQHIVLNTPHTKEAVWIFFRRPLLICRQQSVGTHAAQRRRNRTHEICLNPQTNRLSIKVWPSAKAMRAPCFANKCRIQESDLRVILLYLQNIMPNTPHTKEAVWIFFQTASFDLPATAVCFQL